MLHCQTSSDLQNSFDPQQTGGERSNWTLLKIAHPSIFMVNAEMINQTDEVRSVCAHAWVCFSASSHAASTEPREITEVRHHSFALIQSNIQVAWPTAPMNTLDEQRVHAASSDVTIYIYISKSKLNRPSPECSTECLMRECTLFPSWKVWIYIYGLIPHHWKSQFVKHQLSFLPVFCSFSIKPISLSFLFKFLALTCFSFIRIYLI